MAHVACSLIDKMLLMPPAALKRNSPGENEVIKVLKVAVCNCDITCTIMTITADAKCIDYIYL